VSWFDLPIPQLRAYAEAMRGIRARESLQLAAAVALGTGSLSKRDAAQLHSQWRREAQYAKAPQHRMGLVEALTVLGIPITKQSAAKEEAAE
jgi:hypothetical protein